MREQFEGVQRYLTVTVSSLYSPRSLQRARSPVSVRHVSFQHWLSQQKVRASLHRAALKKLSNIQILTWLITLQSSESKKTYMHTGICYLTAMHQAKAVCKAACHYYVTTSLLCTFRVHMSTFLFLNIWVRMTSWLDKESTEPLRGEKNTLDHYQCVTRWSTFLETCLVFLTSVTVNSHNHHRKIVELL